MKNKILSLVVVGFASIAFGAEREIALETKTIDGAIHWTPSVVEVTQGESVKFVVKHDVEGGFDFHGFFIPALKISSQVNRHKPETVVAKIPSSLKPGEYPIGCQFHPKHVAAKLVVKKK
jgi:plastocyanin